MFSATLITAAAMVVKVVIGDFDWGYVWVMFWLLLGLPYLSVVRCPYKSIDYSMVRSRFYERMILAFYSDTSRILQNDQLINNYVLILL